MQFVVVSSCVKKQEATAANSNPRLRERERARPERICSIASGGPAGIQLFYSSRRYESEHQAHSFIIDNCTPRSSCPSSYSVKV